MKKNIDTILKTIVKSTSARNHLNYILFLIKLTYSLHIELYENFIVFFLYRLNEFKINADIEDLKELLSGIKINDNYLNKLTDIVTYDTDKVLYMIPFINYGYNKNSPSYSYNPHALRDFCLDVFKLCSIEKINSFWNGNGYIQGDKKLIQKLSDLGFAFKLKHFKADNFYKDYCNNGTLKSYTVKKNLIPTLDKVIRVDESNLDLEHISIVNHTSDNPTVNPLQVEIGSIKTGKELEQEFFDPETDKCFDEWSNNDKDIKANLEEVLGLVLIHASGQLFRTAVFLHSDRAQTGKTTFCEIIKNLVGSDNTSVLSLNNLDTKNNRFNLIELIGKRLNIGDETAEHLTLDAETIAVLKNVFNNNSIFVESKGLQGHDAIPTCTFIYACNSIPFSDEQAFNNRLLIIPFNHVFDKTKYRDNVIQNNNVDKTIKHFFLMGLKGAIRLLKRLNNKEKDIFTPSKTRDNHLKEIRIKNDPLYRWIQEHEEIIRRYDKFYRNSTDKKYYQKEFEIKTLYEMFTEFCKEGGYYKNGAIPNKTKFENMVTSTLKMYKVKANFRSVYNKKDVKHDRPLVFSAYPEK